MNIPTEVAAVPHPIQPLCLDERGVLRFKANAIVRHLLDNGGISLNDLAFMEFTREDREQFAQLIGYSHSGSGDLSYMSDAVWYAAQAAYEKQEARLESAITKAEAVAPDFSVSIGGLNVPLSTAVERMRKRAQELQARQRILSACVSKADPTDGGTANLLYCAADTIKKLQLDPPATPAESSEQVIDLLLAGGFIDKDKLRVAREIIAGCKKPAVPVESVPEGWREFLQDCSECAGGEVNGNKLAMRASLLLKAATPPTNQEGAAT